MPALFAVVSTCQSANPPSNYRNQGYPTCLPGQFSYWLLLYTWCDHRSSNASFAEILEGRQMQQIISGVKRLLIDGLHWFSISVWLYVSIDLSVNRNSLYLLSSLISYLEIRKIECSGKINSSVIRKKGNLSCETHWVWKHYGFFSKWLALSLV